MGKGRWKTGTGKKAAVIWGPREEGDPRWNKNQMRAFDNVHEKLENMLAAVLEDPEHDDVEVAKLRDELDYLQCKRCELRKGNVIREVATPIQPFRLEQLTRLNQPAVRCLDVLARLNQLAVRGLDVPARLRARSTFPRACSPA